MKRLLLAPFALLALAAAPRGPAPDRAEQELIALERQSWEAWQHHDVAFWQHFLSDDHVEVQIGGGFTGKSQVIAGIANGACTVTSYQVDQFSFHRFGPDTAMLVYRAAQDTHCGSFAVPSPVWATSLFVRRDGRWQNVLYQHSAASD